MTDIRITAAIIAAIAPFPKLGAELVAEAFDPVCAEYGIDSPARVADFLAQCAHESAGFGTLEEDLNFSAERLAELWARFSETGRRGGPPTALARRIARDRAAISAEVYGGFHGRGFIQLSLRDNYERFFKATGLDVVGRPALLLETDVAATASCWFWRYGTAVDLNSFADAEDRSVVWRGERMPAFEAQTRAINGGMNGWADRLDRRARARRVLGA